MPASVTTRLCTQVGCHDEDSVAHYHAIRQKTPTKAQVELAVRRLSLHRGLEAATRVCGIASGSLATVVVLSLQYFGPQRHLYNVSSTVARVHIRRTLLFAVLEPLFAVLLLLLLGTRLEAQAGVRPLRDFLVCLRHNQLLFTMLFNTGLCFPLAFLGEHQGTMYWISMQTREWFT